MRKRADHPLYQPLHLLDTLYHYPHQKAPFPMHSPFPQAPDIASHAYSELQLLWLFPIQLLWIPTPHVLGSDFDLFWAFDFVL